jgi:hypothetical protein
MYGPAMSIESSSALERFCKEAGLDNKSFGSFAAQNVFEKTGKFVLPERSTDETSKVSPLQSPISQIVIGDPPEVVLTLCQNWFLEIGEYEHQWRGSHEFVSLYLKNGLVLVSSEGTCEKRTTEVLKVIDRLSTIRRKKYKVCVRCDDQTPPEWWFGDGLCQGCASEYLGVVY